MPPYRLGRHWNTIQAYLIPGIEDDIGELSEEMKKFMGICELLIDDKERQRLTLAPPDIIANGAPDAQAIRFGTGMRLSGRRRRLRF
jgi:hypothetical protein